MDKSHELNVSYWLQGEDRQNFGDYLSEYLLDKALLGPRVYAAEYRLLGSCLDELIIRNDLNRYAAGYDDKIAFWCCGKRDEREIPADVLARCIIGGVRGPLTLTGLGLGTDTAMGDPALLLPLFHTPEVRESTAGKIIGVPHFQDQKSADELFAASGVDLIVSPDIRPTIQDLCRVIDEIVSARFVLCGSLHAAIIACAYDVPFAFWDTGFVDIPFKFRDFAASVDCPVHFVSDAQTGEKVYSESLRSAIRKPKLLPILACCPFYVRPSLMIEALRADGVISDENRNAIIEALEDTDFRSDTYADVTFPAFSRGRLETEIARFENSRSWRCTAFLRRISSLLSMLKSRLRGSTSDT